MSTPYAILFARLALGGIFLASAIGKLLDKPGTEASMSRYPFLPRGSGRLIAAYFPFVELAVGACLFLGFLTVGSAVAAVALFAVFTALHAYDLTYNKNVSCHCFGKFSEEKLTPWAVVRNVLLMALAVFLIAAFDGWLSVDGTLARSARQNYPTALNALPVALLALATVGITVLGGQAVAMVRTTLRGMGFR